MADKCNNLKQQVKEGDVVPLTLVVEDKDKKRSSIEVKAPAKPLATAHTIGIAGYRLAGRHGV